MKGRNEIGKKEGKAFAAGYEAGREDGKQQGMAIAFSIRDREDPSFMLKLLRKLFG